MTTLAFISYEEAYKYSKNYLFSVNHSTPTFNRKNGKWEVKYRKFKPQFSFKKIATKLTNLFK